MLESQKNYQKKSIRICGDVDISLLKQVDGVLDVITENLDTIVKIKSDTYINSVFEVVKKSASITKFVVEDASLNEIFLSIVGEAYEK